MNSTEQVVLRDLIEQCAKVIENITTTQGNLVTAIKVIHEHFKHTDIQLSDILARIKKLEDKTNA